MDPPVANAGSILRLPPMLRHQQPWHIPVILGLQAGTRLDLMFSGTLPVIAQAPVAVAHHKAAKDQDDEHGQAEEDEREVLSSLHQTVA